MASSASTTRPRPRRCSREAGGFKGDKITLSYNADAAHKEWTEATCNSIKQALGVECQAVGVVDFATFRSQIADRKMKGLFRTGWQMDYPSIENFLAADLQDRRVLERRRLLQPGSSTSSSSRRAAATDPAAANAKYQEAEALLAKDMAVHPDVVRQGHDGLVGQGHRREDHRLRHDRPPVDLREVR